MRDFIFNDFILDKKILFFYDTFIIRKKNDLKKGCNIMKLLSKKIMPKQNSQAQLPKLNRISGQIEGIKRMIESDRECADVLTQLRSVRAAIKSIEGNLLNAHLQERATQSFKNEKEREKALSEIQSLFTRFEN